MHFVEIFVCAAAEAANILRGMPFLSVEAALTGNGIQWKWYATHKSVDITIYKEFESVSPIVNKAVICDIFQMLGRLQSNLTKLQKQPGEGWVDHF